MAWQIDPAHSEIQFSVRHMMISKVRGTFQSFSGVVEFDEENPAATNVEVSIDTASVSTRNTDRDNHLKSADFFDAENYPVMTFVSKRVEVNSDSTGKLIGDLTIKDVTREVTLDVEYAGQALSPWGTTSAGFSAKGKLNRENFGLTWNAALETGGVLVGTEIEIAIELEIVKQAEAEGEAAAA
ncbi:MAG: polyisoprenoid-binding protein [Anaerolineales bacterium]|nr:polyisoprenoid-binding protein [Anaerolineales bacterium]